MKSKKGALFHWIIFGVLAALGLFLILTAGSEAKRIPGEWHLDFLGEYYFKAEADLLAIDQAAKFVGWQTARELGEKGGFINESECGSLEGYNFWNNLTKPCFPDGEWNFLVKVKEKLVNYSEIRVEGKDLIGKGEKKSIVTGNPWDIPYADIRYVKYTYDTSFRVNLGFDIKKVYENLQKEAGDLITGCNKIENLTKCVKEKRKENWKLKDCDEEQYNETERKVLFCVESEPIRYKLALDFTRPEEAELSNIS